MSWTKPEPTDVILYSYLWRHEAEQGEDAGRKDRPCLVLAATAVSAGLRVITAPITTKLHEPKQTIALPLKVVKHLGLDLGCGVVCNDLNRFTWVGPDVRATQNGSPFFGQVPAKLFDEIRARVIENAVRQTDRDE